MKTAAVAASLFLAATVLRRASDPVTADDTARFLAACRYRRRHR